MPLSGVRVLDLTRLIPGPYAGMVLVGLGAEVVKVEDTTTGDALRWMGADGDGGSAMFTALNRGKRSIRLDLKHERGRRLFLALVATADVVMESFRPGVMERLGVGPDELHAANPRLVLCRVSGFGQDGPDRLRAGHDLSYLARSGVLATTGTRDGIAAIPGAQVGDMGGGGLGAVVAILAALRLRDRTGVGATCDVSMVDGLLAWMAPHLASHHLEGRELSRGRDLLTGAHPCYRVYRCADGELTVAALEPRFWRRLCEVLDLHDLIDDAYAVDARADAVGARIEAVFMTRGRAEWRQRLDAEDVCVEPVLTAAEVLEDAQARHRAGPGWPPAWMPVRVGARTTAPAGPAPGWGADSRSLLAEVGVDDAEFASLVSAGVTA